MLNSANSLWLFVKLLVFFKCFNLKFSKSIKSCKLFALASFCAINKSKAAFCSSKFLFFCSSNFLASSLSAWAFASDISLSTSIVVCSLLLSNFNSSLLLAATLFIVASSNCSFIKATFSSLSLFLFNNCFSLISSTLKLYNLSFNALVSIPLNSLAFAFLILAFNNSFCVAISISLFKDVISALYFFKVSVKSANSFSNSSDPSIQSIVIETTSPSTATKTPIPEEIIAPFKTLKLLDVPLTVIPNNFIAVFAK